MELPTELSTSPYGENKIKKDKRQSITLILFIIVVLFLDWQIYELINENRKSERLSFPKANSVFESFLFTVHHPQTHFQKHLPDLNLKVDKLTSYQK